MGVFSKGADDPRPSKPRDLEVSGALSISRPEKRNNNLSQARAFLRVLDVLGRENTKYSSFLCSTVALGFRSTHVIWCRGVGYLYPARSHQYPATLWAYDWPTRKEGV